MAAALIEFFFGLAPALTVMVIGLGIADYVFVPPYFELSIFDHGDVALLVTYPILTLLIIGLIERLRRSQYHSELVAQVSRSRYEILLRADNERLVARRDADETHRLLRVLTDRHGLLVFMLAVELDAYSSSTARSEVQPGSRFNDVHPDDVERVLSTLTLGSHRVRVNVDMPANRALADTDAYQTVDALCERFATPAGDFVTFRLDQ